MCVTRVILTDGCGVGDSLEVGHDVVARSRWGYVCEYSKVRSNRSSPTPTSYATRGTPREPTRCSPRRPSAYTVALLYDGLLSLGAHSDADVVVARAASRTDCAEVCDVLHRTSQHRLAYLIAEQHT